MIYSTRKQFDDVCSSVLTDIQENGSFDEDKANYLERIQAIFSRAHKRKKVILSALKDNPTGHDLELLERRLNRCEANAFTYEVAMDNAIKSLKADNITLRYK